jgi:hypothetical protein
MINCQICEHYGQANNYCNLFHHVVRLGCQSGTERKPRNNYERVKQMTMEELASFINGAESEGRAYGPKGKAAWLKWLNVAVE